MAEPPKYNSMREYEIAHLLGGPDSPHLEFDMDYYQAELDRRTHTSLAEFLHENPSAIKPRAVQMAAYTALEFFGRPNQELRPSAAERRYVEAGQFAIAGYVASDRATDFKVEQLPFAQNLSIPETELREAGRLSVQIFRVYEAVAETGEVPSDICSISS